MAEIKIAVDVLENKINDLIALMDEWESFDAQLSSKKPTGSAGGQSAAIMEKIVVSYETANRAMVELISNTIVFFKNVKNSAESADKAGAAGIKN